MRFAKVVGALLVGGGVIVLLSSFLVEFTNLSDDPGLGFRQILGIITGSIAAIVGMVLILGRRKKIVGIFNLLGVVFFVGGIFILTASLLVDLAGFHTNPGFGLRQITGVIAGAIAILGGSVIFTRTKNLNPR